jgi:hypothetical protein
LSRIGTQFKADGETRDPVDGACVERIVDVAA